MKIINVLKLVLFVLDILHRVYITAINMNKIYIENFYILDCSNNTQNSKPMRLEKSQSKI
jgi:hypothetical protein